MKEYSQKAGVLFASAETMPTVIGMLLQNETMQEELRAKGREYIENSRDLDEKFVCEAVGKLDLPLLQGMRFSSSFR